MKSVAHLFIGRAMTEEEVDGMWDGMPRVDIPREDFVRRVHSLEGVHAHPDGAVFNWGGKYPMVAHAYDQTQDVVGLGREEYQWVVVEEYICKRTNADDKPLPYHVWFAPTHESHGLMIVLARE